jgi:predicted small secreted protein
MKKYFSLLLSALLLTSCNGWFFQPSGYNPPTPFLPPTRTPSIVTPTAGIVGANSPTPILATLTVGASTPAVVNTDTPIILPTDILSPTARAPLLAVGVTVLGCNTSIDVTHGMGEVTNAFVTLTNTGNMDLTNLKATLFALDEGRDHPDKTVEIALLPVAQEVTIKLTVDSTYQAQTPIQVEVSADGGLFQRVGQDSCLDIGIFAPNPGSLNTPVAVNP